MPAPPRWLLAVPDAVRQLEKLDRDLVTRRDLERLFGVSRARAAQLMRTFGAELAGSSCVLRRAVVRPAPGRPPAAAQEAPGAGRVPRRPPAPRRPWICLSRQPSTNMEQMGSAGNIPNRLMHQSLPPAGPA